MEVLIIIFAQLFVWLLLVSCCLLFFDVFLLLKGRAEGKQKVSFAASSTACVLIVVSYIMLTLSFVRDSFSLWEVYTYSSSSLSLPYKLGDPWIGSTGSMLFVLFIFTLVYLVYRLKGRGKESEFRITTYKIMDVFFIFLLCFTLLRSPFALLSGTPPDGVGLNPLLQTFWVLVHPPVVFLGYVFVFFAFAMALGGMITGESGKEEARSSLKHSLYAAWLFLALGVALGGWWSYEVLGWGGYWAWDPIETASLLPWLALTAYFHLPARSKDMAKEFTLMITFIMILFGTALTRGGLLESVHAFGGVSEAIEAENLPPILRHIYLNYPVWQGLLEWVYGNPVGAALLIFAFCVLLFFFYVARRADKPLYTFDLDTSSLFSVSIFAAYWSLMALLIICFLGDTAPIIGGVFSGKTQAMDVEFYNRWCFPFTLAFAAALMGCNSGLKMKNYAGLIAVVLGVGVILAVLGQPTPNPGANFGLPLLIAAGIAIAYNFARVLSKKTSSARLWGRALVHLAIIIILIGVFVSSAAEEESGNIHAKPGSVIESLGLHIALSDFTVYPGTGSVYSAGHFSTLPEYSALKMNVAIEEERGKVHQESLWMYYYPNHGVVSKPLIISTTAGDVYISMQHTNSCYNSLFYALMGGEIQPEDVILVVKRVPLIWLVWLGILLMGLGMVLLLLGELRKTD
jgi:cytochrome c-type biogenesis protein CcmF